MAVADQTVSRLHLGIGFKHGLFAVEVTQGAAADFIGIVPDITGDVLFGVAVGAYGKETIGFRHEHGVTQISRVHHSGPGHGRGTGTGIAEETDIIVNVAVST
jgi:hypothetical protein